jgi:hypothetical protein
MSEDEIIQEEEEEERYLQEQVFARLDSIEAKMRNVESGFRLMKHELDQLNLRLGLAEVRALNKANNNEASKNN